MNWLLSKGGDGGIADSSGDLPIHYAAIAGKPGAILTLVDKGKQDEFIGIFRMSDSLTVSSDPPSMCRFYLLYKKRWHDNINILSVS